VQRRGQAVLHHVLGLEVRERRVQLLELVEVVEDCLHDDVHGVRRNLGRRDERGEHAVGLRLVRVVRVEAGGDRGVAVVGLLGDELVDRGTRERDELRPAGRRRILDVGRGVAHAVEEAVDLAVAKRRAVLVRLELRGEGEVRELPAHRGEQLLHRGARSGAGVADVELPALHVVEAVRVDFLAREHREGFRVQRHHRAQVAVRAGILELAQALRRVVLDVRLGHAQVELALLDGVHVEHGAAGRLHRAADAVLGAILVHEAADGSARGVVHAGHAAGADGEVLLLRETFGRDEGGGQRQREGESLHLSVSFVMPLML